MHGGRTGHLHEPRDSGEHVLDSGAAAGGGGDGGPRHYHATCTRLGTKTRQGRTDMEA